MSTFMHNKLYNINKMIKRVQIVDDDPAISPTQDQVYLRLVYITIPHSVRVAICSLIEKAWLGLRWKWIACG